MPAEHELPLGDLAEALLEALDRSGVGLMVRSEGGALDFTNRAARELTGGSEAELLAGQTAGRTVPRELPTPGTSRRVELRELPTTDHAHRVVEVHHHEDVSDGVATEVELYFDATDRYQAEQALLRSERRFVWLIEAAPVGIAISRRDQMVYLNPALSRLLGLGRGVGVDPAELTQRMHPEDRAAVLQEVPRRLLSGEPTVRFEARFRRDPEVPAPSEAPTSPREQGSDWVHVEGIALRTVWDREPAGVVFVRDLDHRRRLVAQQAEADRLASTGQLAAGVAHEINNPLSYLLLNLQYLLRELRRDELAPETLPRLHERVSEARHGASRVGRIVRDLTEFSRPGARQTQPVDLRQVVGAALRVTERHLAERAVVEVRWATDRTGVLGEAGALEQVLVNLLVNAAQAIPPGDPDGHRVTVTVSAPDEQVREVEVRDTGAGIPREVQGRIFDPFFTTKPIGEGTGLGLPICHGIVTALGGTITFSTHPAAPGEPGGGTTFRVRLPAAGAPAADAGSVRPPPVGVRPRVLLVDDELRVASLLSRVLTDDCEVTVRTGGRSALEALRTTDYDVVLCDLVLPGITGMDLHAWLAEHRPGAEARLVFMVGAGVGQRATEFLQRVGNPRIAKPFEARQVRRAVLEVALLPRS